MNRRDFLMSSAGAAAVLATRHHGDAGAESGVTVYVGTYTDDGRSGGIYRFRMDARTGAWRPAGVSAAGPNPSFLALHPNGRVLYAANEVEQYAGAASGAVSAFSIDAATGELTLLGRHSSRGGAPCYVSVDRTGHHAFVANYVGGSVAVLPLTADGSLGDAVQLLSNTGSGPRADRQDRPHAHSIVPDPSNRFALSADLGTDQIAIYALDAGTAGSTVLTSAATAVVALRPGAGPRHIAFHPGGRFVYVTNELDATLAAFRFDSRTGALAPVGTVSLIETGAAGEHFPADVHVAPSGRFVYASVRGDNTVVVHAINQTTGALTFVQRVASGGNWPRNFGLDPSGRFLYVAHQRSDSIVGFTVDVATGRLTPSGVRIEVPVPVCVLFAGH